KARFWCSCLQCRQPESFRNLPPVAVIAGHDLVSFFGSPGTGCIVGKIARRQRPPDVENRINDGPSRLHHICALEESLVAHDAIIEKDFVSGIRSGAEVVAVIEIHLHGANAHLCSRHLSAKAHGDAFIGSNVNHKLVGFELAYRSIAEKHEWSALELDCYLSMTRSHTLAGAQVEWHTRPAPVINHYFYRDKSFRPGVRWNAGLRAICRNVLSIDLTFSVLAANSAMQHIF